MESIASLASQLVPAIRARQQPQPESPELRQKVDEFVGLAFFTPLLQQASNTVLQGKYGHGGQGERVFRGQLNEELALCVGRSGRLGLGDAIYRRLSGQRRTAEPDHAVDVMA
jgi:hypothetical protein